MKSKIITLLLLALITQLSFNGCQKDENTDINPVVEGEEFVPNYYKGIAATDTGNPNFPYMIQHENGEVMLLMAEGDDFTGLVYFVDENTTAQIAFNEEMLPSQIIYNNEALVLFENYRDGLVDIAVIVENDYQIYRDIDFPTGTVGKSFTNTEKAKNWAQFFGALGTSLSAGFCVVSAAATAIPTLGVSVPAAVITCGGALLGTVALLSPSDDERINATASTVGYAANAYGCAGSLGTGNPLVIAANCINSIIDAAGIVVEKKDDLIQLTSEIIAAAQGGLRTGDGDVKFTLTWDTDVDLDLYVTEPSGDTIWYGNRSSTTGGQLDTDDRDGFGPENIFWPTDFARPGSYRVEVKMYSGNKSTVFRLKPKLGDNDYYNSVVLGIEHDDQTVFVGNYILSAGSNGKIVGTWEAADKTVQPSIANNLYLVK